MSESAKNILNNYGILGVQMLKAKIEPLSATGKTADSISYEVTSQEGTDILKIFGREYISTLETGRGPRKSNQQGEFLDNMLEYMQARGIGADLTDKKRRQLARFLTLKINREGDATYKKGGRQVYSNDLEKYIEALKEALRKDFILSFRNNLKTSLGNNRTTQT